MLLKNEERSKKKKHAQVVNIPVPALIYAVLIVYLKMQQFMCYHFPMYKSTLKETKKNLEKPGNYW